MLILALFESLAAQVDSCKTTVSLFLICRCLCQIKVVWNADKHTHSEAKISNVEFYFDVWEAEFEVYKKYIK
jgi:hypothetical protein